ncbi:hypothetical protein Lal_00037000 [Lupinus albus]|nr:hypothetical protein Lal_00037000 [Lupinus albus]
MEDLSDVFGGGYNSCEGPMNMNIDMEDGAAWINHEHTFVMEEHFSHHCRRVLIDAMSHQYICTMRKKMEGCLMEVTIEANVDQAFIVSLLVIVDEIKHNKLNKVVKGVTKAFMEIGKVAMFVAAVDDVTESTSSK